MIKKKFTFTDNSAVRLDKFLHEQMPDKTRSYLQVFIKSGAITVNDQVVKPSYLLCESDIIQVAIQEAEESVIAPQEIPLDVYYEDKDIIVINKPKDMVVHPAAGNKENTLVNALLYHCKDLSGINGVIRAGIVHRIDKDTSGLLVACKNDFSHQSLSKQFSSRTVKRKYIALVHGVIPHNHGKINAPIGRSKDNRKLMAVVEDGKTAVTNFTVLERFKEYTLVEARLETGRTHQIRVHFQYIKHPLVGDLQYGPRKTMFTSGQFLHAKTLGFIHPTTKEEVLFESELPDYFNDFLTELRNQA